MIRRPTLILSALVVFLIAAMSGGRTQARQMPQMHMTQPVSAAKWGPAPPLVPAGAQIAVLNGDPTKDGLYAVRFKFPANYAIAAHSHPTDENVTVVSGTFYMGMGNKLDRQGGEPLDAGGYALIPAGTNHWVYTKGEVTIVLFGRGPVDFKYVNPADDPRNAKKN